jgi:hypothetical protein
MHHHSQTSSSGSNPAGRSRRSSSSSSWSHLQKLQQTRYCLLMTGFSAAGCWLGLMAWLSWRR